MSKKLDGDALIIIDDKWVAKRVPDNRTRLQKKPRLWIFPNPFYVLHPSDISWFGANKGE